MAEQLDLDALKQALINSAMGLTFRECHALIDYAQSLEADNLELCGIAQAADAQRRTLESASQPGSGEAEDAARYGFLRDTAIRVQAYTGGHPNWLFGGFELRGATFDNAIDAARMRAAPSAGNGEAKGGT